MSDIYDKLRKIQALASEGTAGEKAAAKRVLARLKEQHGVSDDDIERSVEKWHAYTYRTNYEKKLLVQVLFKLLDTATLEVKEGGRKLFVKVPRHVGDLIRVHYAIYRRELAEHFELMFEAFVQRNDIYPEEVPEGARKKPTNFKRTRQVVGIMDNLDRVQINKLLKGG